MGAISSDEWNEDEIGQLSADLVQERFNNAQSYATAAYNTALDYIQDMQGISDTAPTVTVPDVEVQDVNMDQNAIERPVEPDATMIEYAAPNAPVVDDIAIDVISGIPAFDVPALTISLPVMPETPDIADVGEPDAITPTEYATRPSYVLPTVPILHEAAIPSPPDLSLPTFEGTMPVDDLVCPTNTFNFSENMYSSDLLTAAKTKLQTDIDDGVTGLDPDVEDSIWRREQERSELALQEAKDRVADEWAGRGFMLPDGVLTAQLQELEKEYTNSRFTTSRDIAIKQAEMALQNQQFSLQQTIALEGQLMSYTSQMAQRQLDAAKALIDASIQIFNASVTRYNAKIEGYKAQASVYETRIRGALAQAEIYRTQIEAAKLTIDMDNAYVELYKAQLAGVQSLIDCYKADMEAARLKADVERLKLDAFKTRIDAYTAKANLHVALFNMYDAGVRGEQAKAQIYATQVEAYKSRVDSAKIEASIATEKARIQSEIQKNRIAMYATDVDAYKAKIEAEKTRITAVVEVFQGRVEAYKAETGAEASRIDNIVKAFAAKVEQATKIADLYLKQAEVDVQAFMSTMNLRGDLVKAGAAVASQLAASSMAGVSASAHIGETDSKSKNYSTSNAVSASSSVSNVTTDSHSESQSQSQSESINYNYNY